MRLLPASLLLFAAAHASPADAAFSYQRTTIRAPSPSLPMVYRVEAGSGCCWEQIDEVRDRIRHARNAGLITKKEARHLRREAGVIESDAATFGHDGLSYGERTEIEARTRYLGDAVTRSSSMTTTGH